MDSDQPNWGKMLAITGAFLQLAQLIGAIVSSIGMVGAFNTLGKAGIADPRELSARIGTVLIFTMVGVGISLLGLVLIFLALFAFRYRAVWFFWFLVIYGGLSLFRFPVGSAIGMIFLTYCLTNKIEFLGHPKPNQDFQRLH